MNKAFIFLICICPLPLFAQTWTTQYTGTVFDISFPDSLHGWAAGGKTTSGNGRILFTIDGGNSWNEQSVYFTVSADSYCSITNIAFSDSISGAAGGYWRTNHTYSGYFGSSWILAPTGDGFDTYYVGKDGVSSHYQSGSTVILEMQGGEFSWAYYKGGLSGISLYLNGNAISSSSTLMSICFLNPYYGWMCLEGKLFRTTTGSDYLSPLYDFQNMVDIDLIDSLHGWAVGDSGTILYTDDGGTDSIWDTLNSGVTNNLTCVKFVDSLNGWAGGTGVILRTRDGGQTWVKESNSSVSKICALDTNYAWALISGSSGSILKYHPHVGIEESSTLKPSNPQTLKLQISPNPFILQTVISKSSTVNVNRIRIYNISGELVEETKDNIIGKNLKAGVYFVKVGDSEPVKIIKMETLK